MNDNEVRPIFRVLTLGLSVAAWYAVLIVIRSVLESLNSNVIPFNLLTFLSLLPVGVSILVGAIAFTYTTLFGYMPKKLVAILFGKRPKN
ncbi:hypothetical protein [Colwellia piezophila]|uniref:hypothetical protein n=1 Tax=Colwellia piezophila TaxID=211668 RepID=UPI00037328D5|nr:hypothetical protein [Colwellia piezophila]